MFRPPALVLSFVAIALTLVGIRSAVVAPETRPGAEQLVRVRRGLRP
jgi:hypothetical protein